MPRHVILLRAVNVGGTGKIAMSDLRSICEAIGLQNVRTYIASGNVVADSALEEGDVRSRLGEALAIHVGKPVGVLVRTPAALREVLALNPFADRRPDRTVAIFLDTAPDPDFAKSATGLATEEIAPGPGVIYVHYGDGMGRSRLRIPAAEGGTARNMNTVAVLARMAAES